MVQIRGHSRRKKKRARKEAQAPHAALAAASASASRSGPYQDSKVAAIEQDEDAFSTAGTALGKINSRVRDRIAARRPAYLEDDSSTLASDITRKSSKLGNQSLYNDDHESSSSSDGHEDKGGYDDGIEGSTLILNGKVVDNPDIFLTFDGVTNARHFDGAIRQYLFNERFSLSEKDVDYGMWVKKNLIVAFQGHVLYEDCLSAPATKSQDKYPVNQKHLILSRLQGDIGLPVGYQTHFLQVRCILEAYKRARVDVIAKALQEGQLPEDPSDHLTALLIKLIDRYIMYKTVKTPLRGGPLLEVGKERIDQTSKTLRETLANSDKTKTLFTEVGALIPSKERGLTSTRPWFYDPWVKRNVADVFQPTTNAQLSPQPWKFDDPTLEPRRSVEDTDTSQDPIPYPSSVLPQKRKHNEDMVIRVANSADHKAHKK